MMNGWAGFWISLAIIICAELHYKIQKKKLIKDGIKFNWCE